MLDLEARLKALASVPYLSAINTVMLAVILFLLIF